MSKRKILALFLVSILTLSLFLVGCQKDGLKKVRLIEVTHSVFYAPQYIAMSKGFFEEEGIKVELTNGKGADKCMTALLSGEADIGFMGSEASIYVYNQGKDDYAINFAQLTQKDGSFLVGREKDDNFSFDKLKNKTIIGGRIGGMPEMTLEYVLKKQGLQPQKDVKIRTDIQFDVMAGSFTGGEGDYVTLFEPVATLLEKEGKGHIVASIGKEAGYIPYTSYSATKDYIEKNPEIIQGFTNAIYKGMLWVQSHSSEEVANVLKEHFPDADKDILSTLVSRYKEQDTWKPDPVFTKDGFDYILKIMKSAGQLDKSPPYEKLVITKFAEETLKNIKSDEVNK
ncbi:ABC-type nitrate/sulfonate/bicarbonate transport system, periplasmic component [Gottschalkia purinilytica]|uniref:ABC-type nitrate/sulfonate/bicarbonate transport system, periplasmic component n=1 Tax=Gottschalkia purinilytica TaxID=1503 RepID=A0A0L0W7W4_GOTPU|nr:ABC transporter substrate-binding protein [Gottschalkia purinilytica]KNF07668.1 ABC-type nitrate/sulfonate/bicarbonate transport system, periplasmic component [Gottschalkia purinilytica]